MLRSDFDTIGVQLDALAATRVAQDARRGRPWEAFEAENQETVGILKTNRVLKTKFEVLTCFIATVPKTQKLLSIGIECNLGKFTFPPHIL